MTTLNITVAEAEALKERTRSRIQAAEAGEELENVDPVLNFESYAELDRILSEKNLELLEAIVKHQPASMRETAEIVDRDFKEVHRNLSELETLGVIEFVDEGRAKRPHFPYDDIKIAIDFSEETTTIDENTTHILIVDDEPEIADSFATFLEDSYEVNTAYGGREALELYDDQTDIVLLNRHMPDLSGSDVLEEIRGHPGECQVAIVTGADPDFDVIDMNFDDYLTKPITGETLQECVERLLARSKHDKGVQRYLSLVTKRETLKANKDPSELGQNKAFQNLQSQIDELETELETPPPEKICVKDPTDSP